MRGSIIGDHRKTATPQSGSGSEKQSERGKKQEWSEDQHQYSDNYCSKAESEPSNLRRYGADHRQYSSDDEYEAKEFLFHKYFLRRNGNVGCGS